MSFKKQNQKSRASSHIDPLVLSSSLFLFPCFFSPALYLPLLPSFIFNYRCPVTSRCLRDTPELSSGGLGADYMQGDGHHSDLRARSKVTEREKEREKIWGAILFRTNTGSKTTVASGMILKQR